MEQLRNNIQDENTPDNKNEERFETDIAKIVHRHLADKNHIITDDDIRSVRISTELPPFTEVITGAEAATVIKDQENKTQSDDPTTPWDTIEMQ